jgi:nucleoside-diphosphate-sugar epimerase
MRVLVTGAFGNIGGSAVQALVRQGHTVRCLARPTRAYRRAARRLPDNAEVIWGDLRDADLASVVRDQDVIVHLAYMLPPESEEQPEEAESINLGGTRRLLDSASSRPDPPRFLFASSFDVFGHTQHLPPPRRVTDPVQATDHYSGHKLACEDMIRHSGLQWAIFRFCDVPPLAMRSPHPIMFRIPLDTRFEVLHTHDAGLAIANAVDADVWGKVSLIGGGRSCQVLYRDYLGSMLDMIGVGRLPEEAFGQEPYCTDWLDTDESQCLLEYQRHSFQEIVRDVARAMGPTRFLARPVRPIVRWWMLRLSPYWPTTPPSSSTERRTGAGE